MLFLTTHKLPFVWECYEHGECDHTIQLQSIHFRFHCVTVRVVCCQCYEEARHTKERLYPYTEFDIHSFEWLSILTELHLNDASEN
jgi:hypothetical protein